MSYVLRVKGETKGWIFAEGFVGDSMYNSGRDVIDTGKMKYADEWNSYEEAIAYKTAYDTDNQFDIVEYKVASMEYYND